jgi:hypothetical protein
MVDMIRAVWVRNWLCSFFQIFKDMTSPQMGHETYLVYQISYINFSSLAVSWKG